MTEASSSPVERLAWPLLGAVVLVGLVLRLWTFNEFWINPDEGIYYSVTSWGSWATFWAELSGNAHPPLYYLVVRGVSVLSNDFAMLRAVAMVFGCACIPAVFLLVRAWMGGGAAGVLGGLLAALVFAVSPTMVELSQVIRPYTMLVCALTFAAWFLVRYLIGAGGLLGYALCMAAALLTHYSAMIFVGALALALGVQWATRRLQPAQVRSLLIFNAPLAVLCGALFFLHMRAMASSDLATGAMDSYLWPLLINTPGEAWSLTISVFELLVDRPLQGPALVVFVVGLVLAFREQRRLVFWLPVAILFLAVLGSWTHKYPFGSTRHSLYIVPVLVVPIAFAFGQLIAAGGLRMAVTLVALGVLAAGSPWISPLLGADPPRRIGERVLPHAGVEECRPIFAKTKESAGLLVMPLQAYYTLLPLFAEESQTAEWSKDRRVRRFRWGQRGVIVSSEWRFHVHPDERGKPSHLFELVQAIDQQFPDIQLSAQPRVVFFFAGWTDEAKALNAIDTPGAKLVVRTGKVPGFAAVEFELGRYLKLEAGSRRGR